MNDLDRAIYKACQMEKATRINYFLNNTQLIYKNAGFDDSKFQDKINKLKTEIAEANMQIQNLMRYETKKLRKGDDGFDMKAYQERLRAIYPELSEPRSLTHDMRPVPAEHFEQLYNNGNKEGALAYLNERYKVPPAQRYYFPATSSWEYGWRPPPSGRDKSYGRTFALKNFMWRVNGVATFQREKQIPSIIY